MPERLDYWRFETFLVDIDVAARRARELQTSGLNLPRAIAETFLERARLARTVEPNEESPKDHALNAYIATLEQIERAQTIATGGVWQKRGEKINYMTPELQKQDDQNLAYYITNEPDGVKALAYYVRMTFARSAVGQEGWQIRIWAVHRGITEKETLIEDLARIENRYAIPNHELFGRVEAYINFQRLTEHLASH